MDLQSILQQLFGAATGTTATDEPLEMNQEKMKEWEKNNIPPQGVTESPDGAFDGEFPPENEGAQFPERVRQRPFADQRPSTNVETRQPGNLLDTLDYAEQKARRGIIGMLPEALRTSNMQDWMKPENDPDRYKGQADWFARPDFHMPSPMETTQIKREAARPGDPVTPIPGMTDELYGAAPGPQASAGQALLASGMKGDMPLPPCLSRHRARCAPGAAADTIERRKRAKTRAGS
jgi:hypothetical protein